MWYAVFDIETGRLYSVGEDLGKNLPDTLGVLEVGDDLPSHPWDETARAFVAPKPEPVAEPAPEPRRRGDGR